MLFKKDNTEWLHISHGHVKAFIKTIITDALINRSESGKLSALCAEKNIPTKNSSPMKDPGVNFKFEANGDLLFQGYLIIENGNLPAIALELTKYAFEVGVFPSVPSFAEWVTKLHN